MKIIKCDRCGNETKEWRMINSYSFKNKEGFDLCESCFKEFVVYMDKFKLIDLKKDFID